MSPRSILAALSIGRLVLGVIMVIAPRELAVRWLGRGATGPESTVFLRATGIRDCGYAVGALQAVRSGADPKPWLAAGIAIDGTDMVATLAAGGVPLKTRLAGSVGAVLAVVANAVGVVAEES